MLPDRGLLSTLQPHCGILCSHQKNGQGSHVLTRNTSDDVSLCGLSMIMCIVWARTNSKRVRSVFNVPELF